MAFTYSEQYAEFCEALKEAMGQEDENLTAEQMLEQMTKGFGSWEAYMRDQMVDFNMNYDVTPVNQDRIINRMMKKGFVALYTEYKEESE